MMSLSLRAMRYVQAALKQGNISRAAETMNVAPSAIASALAQAEDTFGMALVTRARAKGIFPTPAGREIQHRIEDLLDRYDTMLIDASDLRTGVTGTLTIGYNAPIAPAFLPKVVAHILAAHPEVSVSMIEGDNESVRAGLLEGQFDAIVFVEEVPSPQIATRPLIFAPTYCLCAADHAFANEASLRVSDIVSEPLVLLDRPAARSYYMELLSEQSAPVRIAATTNSTEMARSLVAEGLGISLLNMRPRDLPAYSGKQVRCIPIVGTRNGVQLSLGFAPGPLRLLTEFFADTCAGVLGGHEGDDFIVPTET